MAAYFGQLEKPVGDRRIARSDPQLARGARLRHTHIRQAIRPRRRSAFSVQRSAFSVQRSAFSVQRSAFSVQRSAFSVRRRSSTVPVRRSAAPVKSNRVKKQGVRSVKDCGFFPNRFPVALPLSHFLFSHFHHQPLVVTRTQTCRQARLRR
jgi:hypothetical protein